MACTIKELKDKVLNKIGWEDKDGYSNSVIIYGPPGLGKTSLIIEIVRDRLLKEKTEELKNVSPNEYDKKSSELRVLKNILEGNDQEKILEVISPHFLDIRLAERPIEQLQGVVVPSLSQEFVKFVFPENIAKIKNSNWGILFLDELDKASDSKFAAATHLMENKSLGDYKLPPGWVVIAACNREEDSHLANPIPPELRNRSANIEVTIDFDSWCSWAESHNFRKDLLRYLKRYPLMLAKYDEPSYSFRTPRSWTNASRSIDRLEKRVNPKTQNEVDSFYKNYVFPELEDFIGPDGASDFKRFREIYMKYDIEKILKGELQLRILGDETDHKNEESILDEQFSAMYALMDNLTLEKLRNDKMDDETKRNYLDNFVNFVSCFTPELKIIYLKDLNPKILKIMPYSQYYHKIENDLQQLLVG